MFGAKELKKKIEITETTVEYPVIDCSEKVERQRNTFKKKIRLWFTAKKRKTLIIMSKEQRKYHCDVCGKEISKVEYEDHDCMCWECWDDQLTEESDDMFGDLM